MQQENVRTESDYSHLNDNQSAVLLISILIVALCGIAYELIIGTVSSYLLGNSVYQFSLTIGFFMFAMGVGSYLSKLLGDQLIQNFIKVEVAIALVGGICSILLFMAFPLARVLYETVMYSLILIIGALVGMEIPILTTILSQRSSTRDSIANVLSLDYIGALIGSVAFPLILLPQLGLVTSSFAIGIINMLTALVSVYVFKDYLKSPRLMKAICWSALIVLIVFVVMGAKITSYAEKHLYFDQVIYDKQTAYQRIVMTRSNVNREQRLYIDGHIQFSSRDEYRYHESLVHPLMSLPGNRSKVLVLGGGDGLAARELLKYDDIELIHLVDIDPEMTRVANELAVLAQMNGESLKSEKVTVFNEDAFTFINQPGVAYDRVIIDMPDPHNEALNKLYSKEFYTMIKRRMDDKGYVVSQSSSPFFTRNTFWCIEETLDFVFDDTLSYHASIPSFGVWGFNLASMNGIIPDDFSFEVATRYLDDSTMQAAMVFGKDVAEVASPVNTIMEPKLYQLYVDEVQK
ncbi:polyamine aminopropyltransferase [Pleionea sp. CnH1-48]|uniref:polyamine aminopropyltransferase n=1 Tax=Pleionea sp. CnH1-48 TaxID=2954494 RepID=UPI0020982B5C|nr:polyamine aminopropyltransferase [Pleionea sp. CnH1-48]MCO7224604.1 polyamine aminopropyltransferase [Pleionea sp. CnH1-48]